MKRCLSFLMVFAMLLSNISPIVTLVSAEEPEPIEISVGFHEVITFTETENTVWYSFTPTESDKYMLTRWNWGGSYGELELTDPEGNPPSMESFDYNGQWFVYFDGEAGETYQMRITLDESATDFNISLGIAPELNSISFAEEEYTFYYCDHEGNALHNEAHLSLDLEPWNAYDTIVSVDTGSELVEADSWLHGIPIRYSGIVDTTLTVQTASGKTAQCRLHIAEAPKAEGLYVDGLEPAETYAPGDVVYISLEAEPENACYGWLESFASSNTEVALLEEDNFGMFHLEIQSYGTTILSFEDAYGNRLDHLFNVRDPELCPDGHTVAEDPEVPPTCKETGLSAGQHCAVCEDVLIQQVVLPTVDHSYQNGACEFCGDTSYLANGQCGPHAFWLLEHNGTLTVSGEGEMTSAPWGEYSMQVKKLVIEEGITSVCMDAFSGFKILKEISLPDSLLTMGHSAFSGCISLQNVTIPENTTVTGQYVFSGCTGLTEVSVLGKLGGLGAFYGCDALKKVILGENCTKISRTAFSGCSALEDVTVPSALTYIGYRAFEDCINLKSITIPSSVTAIDDMAFYRCDGMEAVYISDLVAWCNIEFVYDFSDGCNPLEYGDPILYLNGEPVIDLVIPDTVPVIRENAFLGYSRLKSVVIPGETEIQENAFLWCDNLESVVLSEGITLIPENLFYGCKSLKEVTIPVSVSVIDENAFNLNYEGQAIETVHYAGSEEQWSEISILPGNESLTVGYQRTNCVHEWTGTGVELEPTCTEAGAEGYACPLCGDTKTEPIAAKGHTFVDGLCRCGEVDEDVVLLALVEQQIRDYADSVDQPNAGENAFELVANHAVFADGEKLVADESHPLTVTIWNSEMFQRMLADGCMMAIRTMQQTDISELAPATGAINWYEESDDSNSAYNLYVKNSNAPEAKDRDWKLCSNTNYQGLMNDYDEQLYLIAGTTALRVEIKRTDVTETEATYHVSWTIKDRFDFTPENTPDMPFEEFDWESGASMDLVVPYSCSHTSQNYHWTYDPENYAMVSDGEDQYTRNTATQETFVDSKGATKYYYELEDTVRLHHDRPWVLEFDSVKANSFVLSPFENELSITKPALVRKSGKLYFVLENYVGDDNFYGVNLSDYFTQSNSVRYTFRLENQPAEDGRNKIFLSVWKTESQEVLIDRVPMEKISEVDGPANGISGVDFYINYIGYKKSGFTANAFDLRVWENGIEGASVSHITDIVVPSTCSESGYSGKACVACGYTLEKTELKPIEHSFGATVQGQAPTCTEIGWEDYVYCLNCDYSTYEEIPASGHSFENGKCSCGAEDPDYVEPIDPNENEPTESTEPQVTQPEETEPTEETESSHVCEYVEDVTKPTCTAAGYTTYTCSCGDHYVSDEVNPLGHREVIAPAVAPTCTEAGKTEGKHCSVCNEILVQQSSVDPLAEHPYDDGTILEDSTDTIHGTIEYVCTICGDSYTEELPLYDFYGYVGDTKSLKITSNFDYEMTARETDGKNVEIISNGMGWSLTGNGLQYFFYFDLHFPEAGTFCIAFEQLLSAPTYYTVRIVEKEEADQEQPSDPNETIPPSTDPEETEPTVPDHICKFTETVTKPTCADAGYTTYTCDCGIYYVKEGAAALGHTWSKWVTVLEPTTGEEGIRRHKCTTCGKAEGQILDKLTTQFKDVKESDYFAVPVTWAVKNEITNGVANDQFGPDQDCTRAQVVTFLWRAAGEPEPTSTNNPFTDVKAGEYYYKAVLWAVEQGITQGMSKTTFGTNATCTRGQVATFLWRFKGAPSVTGNNPFKDVEKDAYYYEPVLWAVDMGITNGTSETTFAPNATCTRGQIVTFLYRAIA